MKSVLLIIALVVESHAALSWRRKKQKRRMKDGCRNRAPDIEELRVGVKFRPTECPVKSQKGNFIKIDYNATLYSDEKKVFDSSILREEPFVFQLGKQTMHDGFEKGLLRMCIGEKRKLVVPSKLAYGEVGGFGSESAIKIKPNETVVYYVELLDILSEEAASPFMIWD